MSDNEVTIERLRPTSDPVKYLRCGGCLQLQHVKLLDAVNVDLGEATAMQGAAFMLVYFCRGREVCENKASERFARWLNCEGLFVAGEAKPPPPK